MVSAAIGFEYATQFLLTKNPYLCEGVPSEEDLPGAWPIGVGCPA